MAHTLNQLTGLVVAFRNARDWKQFHNPKDLAISLVLEAAELLETTQWRDTTEMRDEWKVNADAVGAELSDVLYWLLLIAHDSGIDLEECFARKLEENERKYPVAEARGRHEKYTTYLKSSSSTKE